MRQQPGSVHLAAPGSPKDFRAASVQFDARASIPVQIVQLQSAWVAVGKAWQDCHPSCEMCEWNVEKSQKLPYGEGAAIEFYSECTLGNRGEKPCQCPAVTADQHEEQQA